MCGGGEGCRELAALRRDLRRDLGRAWRLMSGSAWSVVSRSIACRAVSHVACAGRAGAVIACGGVWYGRGAQRPYGTEAGEGDCVVSGRVTLVCRHWSVLCRGDPVTRMSIPQRFVATLESIDSNEADV